MRQSDQAAGRTPAEVPSPTPQPWFLGRSARLLGGGALLIGALGACAVTPTPATLDEQIAQVVADREAMFAAQAPITAPVTLEQAMARAIAYNLDHRVGVLERALEDRLLDVSKQDLLPRLTTRAGLRTRSNELLTVSETAATGERSIDPSLSQDRSGASADAQLSWNILDFGLSYYGARSQANRILATEERRRRVVQTITEQVRAAWWEAVTAERLRPQVARVLVQAREVLAYAEQTERQRLLPPTDALRFQKSMLEIVQQLEAVDAELSVAKAQLASLMNLPPATPIQLAVPAEDAVALPGVALSLVDLEAVAMVQRPEVREQIYLARGSAAEARSALLRLLPGASLYGGLNYDSNSYLVNQTWADAGVQVTWNLFSLLKWSEVEDANAARKELDEARRLAVRMAVLTQVNLAWHRLERARQLYAVADQLNRVEGRILANMTSATDSDAQNRLEQVRAAAAAVLATRSRDRALAELQNAVGALYASAGIDPLPDALESRDIDAVAAAIARVTRELEAGNVPVPAIGPMIVPQTAAIPDGPQVAGRIVADAAIPGLRTLLMANARE